MHVIVISDHAVVEGGATRVAVLSAIALAQRGVRVTFVYGGGEADPDLAAAGVATISLDLPNVWELPRLDAARHGVWSKPAARRLWTVLGDLGSTQPTLHIHQWTKRLSPSIFATAAATRLRTLVTLHDYFLVCPNGAYFDFPRAEPCTLRPLSMPCALRHCDSRGRMHKAIRVLRQARTKAAADGHAQLDLLHVSAFAYGVARPFLPDRYRSYIVRNPIATLQEPPVRVEQNSGFLFVGRFTPEKGCVEAAHAARLAGVPITLVGGGPMHDAIRLANPDAVILPWADRATVARLLDAARAVLLPSLWYETSALVVAEAAARGVPAIISRTTGAAQWVGLEEGVSTVMIQPGAATELAGAMEELQDDRMAAAFGQASYAAFWRDPPTPDAHARRLTEIYSESCTPDAAAV